MDNWPPLWCGAGGVEEWKALILFASSLAGCRDQSWLSAPIQRDVLVAQELPPTMQSAFVPPCCGATQSLFLCFLPPHLNTPLVSYRKAPPPPALLDVLRGEFLACDGFRSISCAFDHVFGGHASQEDVFKEVSGFVQSALDGYKVRRSAAHRAAAAAAALSAILVPPCYLFILSPTWFTQQQIEVNTNG